MVHVFVCRGSRETDLGGCRLLCQEVLVSRNLWAPDLRFKWKLKALHAQQEKGHPFPDTEILQE